MSENKIDYGKLTKQVVFTENDHRHAQLVLKLKYLRITQSSFFRHIITGLLNDDPRVLEYTNEISFKSKENFSLKLFAGSIIIIGKLFFFLPPTNTMGRTVALKTFKFEKSTILLIEKFSIIYCLKFDIDLLINHVLGTIRDKEPREFNSK